MTISEAAKVLGVAPVTLRLQAAAGKLRATKHGPIWWVTPAEVERYRERYLGRHGRRPVIDD